VSENRLSHLPSVFSVQSSWAIRWGCASWLAWRIQAGTSQASRLALAQAQCSVFARSPTRVRPIFRLGRSAGATACAALWPWLPNVATRYKMMNNLPWDNSSWEVARALSLWLARLDAN
jgi:hypothetical protein